MRKIDHPNDAIEFLVRNESVSPETEGAPASIYTPNVFPARIHTDCSGSYCNV
jgi:hypothetical protein